MSFALQSDRLVRQLTEFHPVTQGYFASLFLGREESNAIVKTCHVALSCPRSIGEWNEMEKEQNFRKTKHLDAKNVRTTPTDLLLVWQDRFTIVSDRRIVERVVWYGDREV